MVVAVEEQIAQEINSWVSRSSGNPHLVAVSNIADGSIRSWTYVVCKKVRGV